MRLHQRIELTPEGVQLLNVATECLDRLADTLDQISGRGRSERIHLSTTPLLSARWLMPKLNEFLKVSRNTEIVLHHSLESPNDREPKFDLKIYFSTRRLAETNCEFLFADRLAPMCSPQLLKEFETTSCSAMLSQAGIVHEFGYEWWTEWCRRKGVDPAIVERGVVLDDPAVLENAAVSGHGIILGSMFFLDERLKVGQLVLPFGPDPSFPIFYYLLTKPDQSRRAGVAAFRKWLLKSASQALVQPGSEAYPNCNA